MHPSSGEWSSRAFQSQRRAQLTSGMLSPIYDLPLTLYLTLTNKSIDALLAQDIDENEHPVYVCACLFKSLRRIILWLSANTLHLHLPLKIFVDLLLPQPGHIVESSQALVILITLSRRITWCCCNQMNLI